MIPYLLVVTSFDPPSYIRHPAGFYFFPKKSRNDGNWYKIKPKCLWNAQIGEFLEFDEENWKKYKIMSKKVDFWPNLHKTSGCYENIKNDGHTINILKYPRWMNEQLMKVSALRVNRLLKILKIPSWVKASNPHPPSLYVRGLRDIAKSFAFIELPLP